MTCTSGSTSLNTISEDILLTYGSGKRYLQSPLPHSPILVKCLDPDDIRRSMTALPNIGQEPDLTGWWRLDTGYGTTAFDLTLNKRDGIIDGAAWTSLAPRTAASHPSTLIEDLRSMFNSPVFSDIRISAGADPENDVIFAHRIILSQRSDVFKAMLTSGATTLSAFLLIPNHRNPRERLSHRLYSGYIVRRPQASSRVSLH